MTNAELIKALRTCADNNAVGDKCYGECPYNGNYNECVDQMILDAADALEAADKRIAELEAQLPKRGAKMDAESEADADYQASVLMQEYFERYEPTYNSEDGSM